MKRRIGFRRRCEIRRIRTALIIISVLALPAIFFFSCRPVVTAFAESQAIWNATKIAHSTVAEALQQRADLCAEMIRVTYTDTTHLSSVTPDTATINVVRTDLTARAMDEMEKDTALSVSIPMGTLLGAEWLSGWGPLVTFPMSYTATVLSEVSSSLEAVGINQSMYRVLIHLDISLYVVTPSGRSSVGTRVSYPMAEAILLGEVPDNLTEVYGDDQTLLGKIFDYGTAE